MTPKAAFVLHRSIQRLSVKFRILYLPRGKNPIRLCCFRHKSSTSDPRLCFASPCSYVFPFPCLQLPLLFLRLSGTGYMTGSRITGTGGLEKLRIALYRRRRQQIASWISLCFKKQEQRSVFPNFTLLKQHS